MMPEEMERWTLAVKLQVHFLNDREYQTIIRQDMAPRFRAMKKPTPSDFQRLATIVDQYQDWESHPILSKALAKPGSFLPSDPVERAALAEYMIAVHNLVKDRMRLTWQGEPLAWAVRLVNAAAARSLLPAADPDYQSLRYANAPVPVEQAYFVLYGSSTRLYLEVSGMDPIDQRFFGREGLGFGNEEWEDLERRAIALLQQGLRHVRGEFEKSYSHMPRRRAKALARDEQTLVALFHFLFHRHKPVDSSGPGSRRDMRKLANLLGIDLPRN
jgi:hypothetical protein